MVEHFRVQLNERYGFSVRGATREALRRLEQYPWRGNVREVEALVEQAMIFRRTAIYASLVNLSSDGAVLGLPRSSVRPSLPVALRRSGVAASPAPARAGRTADACGRLGSLIKSAPPPPLSQRASV
jgi:DNA-binding NtrC family response regulator